MTTTTAAQIIHPAFGTMTREDLARRLDYAEYQVMQAADAGNSATPWPNIVDELTVIASVVGLVRGDEGFYCARNTELSSGVLDW